MCCERRTYDFQNQDRVTGTWTEIWNFKLKIWKCLCLDSGRTRAGLWGCCRISKSRPVMDRGTKGHHQAAAISKQTQGVCLSWLQGCSQGHRGWVSKGSNVWGVAHGTEQLVPCLSPAGPLLGPCSSPCPQGTPRRDPLSKHRIKGCQHCRAECLEVWRCCAIWVLPLLRIWFSVLKGRMAHVLSTSCCFHICCPCSACSLSLFSWWHFKPWPGDQTIHGFHCPSSHSCAVAAPQTGISLAECWKPQSSTDY